MFSKKKKRLLLGLGIALTIGAMCSLISFFQFFNTLGQRTNDLLYRGEVPVSLKTSAEKIVIVGIDDASLKEYGRISTWPRTLHAGLINELKEDGARIITFDILFSEISQDDEPLAASIKEAGNVILPLVGDTTGGAEDIQSLGIFENGAIGTGHGNMAPDTDGVIRRLPLFGGGDITNPSLSLVTVAEYLRRPAVFDSIPNSGELLFAGREIPLDNWQMLINYSTGASSETFRTISYIDVLNHNYPGGTFADKIVVVGVTAVGFGDTYWTPLGQPLPGVEIHAQAMNTILSGYFIKPVLPQVTILLILLFALIIGFSVMRFRVLWSTLITFFTGILYCLSAFYLFDKGIVLDVFYPLLALFSAALGVNIFNVTLARVEKREISNTFGKYVSSPVSSKILNVINEGSLVLGGEQSRVTVLFADVRGFTSFCEKMEPSVVVEVINKYFSIIIECVLAQDGIVNKFGGDSLMAIWNAPIRCDEHPLLAMKAAVSIQEKIDDLIYRSKEIPQMKFGIGVNTGSAIVGNMGSLDRLEYSVIGDTVNVAARLSSLAPGGKIWVGQETYTATNNIFDFSLLGLHELKGKNQSINIYELFTARHDTPQDPQTAEDRIKLAV